MLTTLLRQAGAGIRVLILFTVLCGIGYPLVTLAVAQLPGLSGPANGSIVYSADGTPAGSALIGIDPVAKGADPYFHTRPAASAKDILGPGRHQHVRRLEQGHVRHQAGRHDQPAPGRDRRPGGCGPRGRAPGRGDGVGLRPRPGHQP